MTSSGPSYDLIEITPELAEQMLGRNGHNRALRARVVATYAEDMLAGRWAENGEAIKVASDGTLLDGQHRLHAIAESGVTQRMLVASGLKMSDQDTVDTGARRGFADVLKLKGETNWIDIASITRRVHLWNRGARRNSGATQPSVPQMLATLEQFPQIRYSADVANRVARRLPVPKSLIGLCHFLFSNIEAEDAEAFFEKLAEGEHLSKTDPIFLLRRVLVDNASASAKIQGTTLLALTIKTWNAYREGREMQVLRWRAGGATPEVFPEPM